METKIHWTITTQRVKGTNDYTTTLEFLKFPGQLKGIDNDVFNTDNTSVRSVSVMDIHSSQIVFLPGEDSDKATDTTYPQQKQEAVERAVKMNRDIQSWYHTNKHNIT